MRGGGPRGDGYAPGSARLCAVAGLLREPGTISLPTAHTGRTASWAPRARLRLPTASFGLGRAAEPGESGSALWRSAAGWLAQACEERAGGSPTSSDGAIILVPHLLSIWGKPRRI